MTKLESLYSRLGGISIPRAPKSGGRAFQEMTGATSSTEEMGSPPPEVTAEAVEPERMTVEELDRVRAWFESDPEEVTARFGEAIEGNLTPEQIRSALQQTRVMLQAPDEAIEFLRAEESLFEAARPLPVDFVQRYVAEPYRTDTIEIKPYERRFEDDSVDGLAGWILWNGLPALKGLITKSAFRWHDDFTSNFLYRVEPRTPGAPLRIALFADFGTGLSHSLYIARQLAVEDYDCAVHLGDVYYTGTKRQYWEYFEKPLAPMVAKGKTKLFLIPENHEGYSGFDGYFYYLDKQRRIHPKTQVQEGSYFCIQADGVQVIGMDTIWHGRGRISKNRVRKWLEDRLEEGRKARRTNVLLTGYHPYEYGSNELNELLTKDLADLAQRDLIDLWFWGNTHYCALFDRTARTPFIGSCIGHGGYPYRLRKRSDDGDRPAPTPFFEESPRFPAELGIRDDRGNNGYAVLTVLDGGELALEYIDWMGNKRYTRRLARRPGERFLSLT
jgi:hypothetical protein